MSDEEDEKAPRELDERLVLAHKQIGAFRPLLASPGWQMLDEMLLERQTGLENALFDAGMELTDKNMREHVSSIRTFRLMRALPLAVLQQAEELANNPGLLVPEKEVAEVGEGGYLEDGTLTSDDDTMKDTGPRVPWPARGDSEDNEDNEEGNDNAHS